KMRHSRWYVDEVPSPSDHDLVEALAPPHLRFAAQDVDGGLVILVEMRLCAPAWRNREEVHAEARRLRTLSGDTADVRESLLPDVLLTRPNQNAGLSGDAHRHPPGYEAARRPESVVAFLPPREPRRRSLVRRSSALRYSWRK